MGYSYFTVDTSVWLDGVTFKHARNTVSEPAGERESAFREVLKKQTAAGFENASFPSAAVPAVTPETNAKTGKPESSPSAVQELPARFADVEDLTPFIVSADNKAGKRFEAELKRTAFSQSTGAIAANDTKNNASPYNMSEKTAKVREQKQRSLKGAGNAKLFPMDTVTRHTESRAKPAFAPAKAPENDGRKIELQHLQSTLQADRRAEQAATVVPAPATAAPAAPAVKAPVDVAAVRTQASEGFGYKRGSLPSGSSEKTSAAAAWFPEAMTRTLDMYEAMNKVAAQGIPAPSKDLSV